MMHENNQQQSKNKQLLFSAFLLTTIFAIIELVFGFITKSMLVMSDAIHMLSDSTSLFLGFLAAYIGVKLATNKLNFGYKRFETIAAFINGVTLVIIPLYIIVLSINRFFNPEEILTSQMLIIGIFGFTINLIVAFILSKGEKSNLNLKAAALHVIGDLLTSLAVILSSLIIMYTNLIWFDPLFSILASIYIIKGGLSVTKEAYHILMEGFPRHLNYDDIHKEISSLSFVNAIEELRIWSLNGEEHMATLKVSVNKNSDITELRNIFSKQGIHSTIEIVQ